MITGSPTAYTCIKNELYKRNRSWVWIYFVFTSYLREKVLKFGTRIRPKTTYEYKTGLKIKGRHRMLYHIRMYPWNVSELLISLPHSKTLFIKKQQEFEDTKGRQSESVYRRRTDNTMAKRKSTKGQTTINKAKKRLSSLHDQCIVVPANKDMKQKGTKVPHILKWSHKSVWIHYRKHISWVLRIHFTKVHCISSSSCVQTVPLFFLIWSFTLINLSLHTKISKDKRITDT